MTPRTLFHSLQFADPVAGATFLEAVGFERAAWYADPENESVLMHAQYNWRDTGGVMFGSAGKRSQDDTHMRSVGTGQCYCVVETDAEVDRLYEAALAAGASSVRAPEDPDYGGRGCTVRDAEGNHWSFGSYPGA